jgi:hypothetical protein
MKNCNGGSREQRTDILALHEILNQFERAVADCNIIVAQVLTHKELIAKERAALGVLRTRLVGMREQARKWGSAVWKLGWNGEMTRDVYNRAEKQINVHERLLDELIWQLWEFREAQP